MNLIKLLIFSILFVSCETLQLVDTNPMIHENCKLILINKSSQPVTVEVDGSCFDIGKRRRFSLYLPEGEHCISSKEKESVFMCRNLVTYKKILK